MLDTHLRMCQLRTLTYLLSFKLRCLRTGPSLLVLHLLVCLGDCNCFVCRVKWLIVTYTSVLVTQLSSACETMVQKHSLFVAQMSDTSPWQKQQQLSFLNRGLTVHTHQAGQSLHRAESRGVTDTVSL